MVIKRTNQFNLRYLGTPLINIFESYSDWFQRKNGIYVFIILTTFVCACTSNIVAPVATPKTQQISKSKAYSPPSNKPKTRKKSTGYHKVTKGDTLYSIAWSYGHDYREIALWNGISKPFVIYPGQHIRLKPLAAKNIKPLQPGPIIAKKNVKIIPKTLSKKSVAEARLTWSWPTTGKIVKSNLPTSKKGVNIAGSAGQAINAAATGDVVYSGSGLLGYGKLIIIKHSETYLSAYAHNNDILVKEGDRVKVGHQIATMGLGNDGRPILHFEIRMNGKPVNPLKHLPNKRS